MDFLAFQNVSFRKLLQLQQALAGPGAWRLPPLWEDRASLQKQLWQQLTELREAQPGALAVGLLQALHAAGMPRMERAIRKWFLPAP